ncbi:patatin-like phospholipase family protein [Thalassospira sp.]|uniref:patatin-like phospholipase family protein n=1 Tax=Thalassospira sp. TaxID=1912094 RepID=UPI002735D0AB|nr:patatin-like phospholipase family protein [Thalassospira sp.]MDP2697126.1 patatin-like phospholipase family protein [Thalassospira sp.]
MTKLKRAIFLSGGGPAVGLSLGVLKRLREEADIKFDVWSSACIGAWLAVSYHQADEGQEIEQSVEFFRKIFRPANVYERFPIAGAFAPDFFSDFHNKMAYLFNPASYNNLIVPEAIAGAADHVQHFMKNPKYWTPHNLNDVLLNGVLAAHPVARFMVGALYQTETKGLAKIYSPDSMFLDRLKFDRLYQEDKPAIFHNAYNLTQQRLELFTNKPEKYNLPAMDGQTLCACSALPFIEEPVEINGDMYCEGATVDTVSFFDFLRLHPDVDEVWVSRILDLKQVRQPQNLYDSLNNLVMMFAASASEDAVERFKREVAESGRKINIIEIPVSPNITYDWTWENLDCGIEDGYQATSAVLEQYRAKRTPPKREHRPLRNPAGFLHELLHQPRFA